MHILLKVNCMNDFSEIIDPKGSRALMYCIWEGLMRRSLGQGQRLHTVGEAESGTVLETAQRRGGVWNNARARTQWEEEECGTQCVQANVEDHR